MLTLEQARAKAVRLMGEILEGRDPADARQERHREATVGRLLDLYAERYLPRKRLTSQRHDRSLIAHYLNSWRSRRLTSIGHEDVARLHTTIGGRAPYQANRLVALIRRLFNLAAIAGLHSGMNPANGIELFREVKRDRFVHPHEFPPLLEALNAEPNPYVRTAFLTALLTGARRDEIVTMQMSALDLERGLWRLPVTKAGRAHVLPLPRILCTLLRTLPRIDGNPFVFVGRGGLGHLVNLKRAWRRICTRAGLVDVRIHDLRRTLGSWLAASGEGLPLIGKVLNHSQPSTTAIYARLDLAAVREALEANAHKMLLEGGSAGPALLDRVCQDLPKAD